MHSGVKIKISKANLSAILRLFNKRERSLANDTHVHIYVF